MSVCQHTHKGLKLQDNFVPGTNLHLLYDTDCGFILFLIILDQSLFTIKNSPRLSAAHLCILCLVSKSHPRALLADSKIKTTSDEEINQLKLGITKTLSYIHELIATHNQQNKDGLQDEQDIQTVFQKLILAHSSSEH